MATTSQKNIRSRSVISIDGGRTTKMFTIGRSVTVRIDLSNGAVAVLLFRFAVLFSVGTPSSIMVILTQISAIGLPSDVLELKHDDLYNFVEAQCGAIQANILRLQLISDATIFLECDNPTEIMQYNSGKLYDLKNDSCLMTTDGSFIVLPGITASFSNLKKGLSKKIEESIKEVRRSRTLPITSTPLSQPPTNQAKSTDELKSHMIKSIDQWVDKYRVDFDLQANTRFVSPSSRRTRTSSLDFTTPGVPYSMFEYGRLHWKRRTCTSLIKRSLVRYRRSLQSRPRDPASSSVCQLSSRSKSTLTA